MAITAKIEFEPRELVAEGNYFGVCIGVYDIGTQPSEKYDPTYKVVLQFELHRKKGVCRDKNGKPLTISGFYPLAFGMNSKTKQKAKLRQAVEGILGRTFSDAEAKTGYDITQLLEKGCRLKITHEKDDKGNSTFDYIETYMPLDEDDSKITPESDSTIYELDPNQEIPDSVPPWIKKQVRKSQEWTAVNGTSTEPTNSHSKPSKTNGKQQHGSKPAPASTKNDNDDGNDDIPF